MGAPISTTSKNVGKKVVLIGTTVLNHCSTMIDYQTKHGSPVSSMDMVIPSNPRIKATCHNFVTKMRQNIMAAFTPKVMSIIKVTSTRSDSPIAANAPPTYPSARVTNITLIIGHVPF